jgi:hypothetical protein
VDQWTQGTDYEHRFVRKRNPPGFTYIRSMVFEHAIERVNSGGVKLSFPLDHAYWMSGLKPVDSRRGIARFQGSSLAIPAPHHRGVPETEAPATPTQGSPYVMVGQAWNVLHPTPALRNAFTVVTTGTRAVTLDLRRMRIQIRRHVSARIRTDARMALSLRGGWKRTERMRLDGRLLRVRTHRGILRVVVPRGTHVLSLRSGARP